MLGQDAEDGFEFIYLRDADHLAQDIAGPAGGFGHGRTPKAVVKG